MSQNHSIEQRELVIQELEKFESENERKIIYKKGKQKIMWKEG